MGYIEDRNEMFENGSDEEPTRDYGVSDGWCPFTESHDCVAECGLALSDGRLHATTGSGVPVKSWFCGLGVMAAATNPGKWRAMPASASYDAVLAWSRGKAKWGKSNPSLKDYERIEEEYREHLYDRF